ncbi:hypothetical protein RUM43_015084, partial [Polyplax serrata]
DMALRNTKWKLECYNSMFAERCKGEWPVGKDIHKSGWTVHKVDCTAAVHV